jgi:hypothetical protein
MRGMTPKHFISCPTKKFVWFESRGSDVIGGDTSVETIFHTGNWIATQGTHFESFDDSKEAKNNDDRSQRW